MSVTTLKYATPPAWAVQAVDQLAQTLCDHAHCEKKASVSAIALINDYPDDVRLVRAMSKLAEEEMRHFREVYELLGSYGARLQRDPGDPYARALFALLRRHPAERKLDRLLVAALIEDRSCERFELLQAELERRGETTLAAQFRRLAISEAGHARLFIRLANEEFGEETTAARLAELAELEAALVTELPWEPRIH
ncbi:MAG: tRNA-(ms[2]io[6]A)-hydroxylase [Polyangiaceae bacterium]|nr:tRNA-(ms[2]io[6]A)-hydroxylase [Polyangiaceae bacterium]MCW5791785.1 tRNA-(ms[2]io[6]A)-hydroxylase [Polyangiaceae bacterium]